MEAEQKALEDQKEAEARAAAAKEAEARVAEEKMEVE
jgi:hypothetical protein